MLPTLTPWLWRTASSLIISMNEYPRLVHPYTVLKTILAAPPCLLIWQQQFRLWCPWHIRCLSMTVFVFPNLKIICKFYNSLISSAIIQLIIAKICAYMIMAEMSDISLIACNNVWLFKAITHGSPVGRRSLVSIVRERERFQDKKRTLSCRRHCRSSQDREKEISGRSIMLHHHRNAGLPSTVHYQVSRCCRTSMHKVHSLLQGSSD